MANYQFVPADGSIQIVGVLCKAKVRSGTTPRSFILPIVAWAIDQDAADDGGERRYPESEFPYLFAKPITLEPLAENVEYGIQFSDGRVMTTGIGSTTYPSLDSFREYIVERYKLTVSEISESPPRFISYLQDAAYHGVPEAQTLLGLACENGLGVKINTDAALKMYKQAADGDGPASTVGCRMLGLLHLSLGQAEMGTAFLESAAKRGDTVSQAKIGRIDV